MPPAAAGTAPVAAVTRPAGRSDILLVCEHASASIPAEFGDLGLDAEARSAHIAWDPGALELARGLSDRLDATLVAATVSRLVYDLNRPPEAPGAMAATSEVYAIPGNAGLTPAERLRRTETWYVPFHRAVQAEVARRLALGRRPVIVTVHSFTPVWFGTPRATELGVIHDADPRMAETVVSLARASTRLAVALNDPYAAADGVTHTLRLHATPYGLPSVMLELRNDLLQGGAAAGVADALAPVISQAAATVAEPEPAGA